MKQRFLSLSVLFGLLLCFIAVQSPAGAKPAGQSTATVSASSITGKVNAADLVLRAQPNTDAPKLEVLKVGDVVTVLGKTANGNWLFVTAADGQIGWVGSAYMVLSGGKLADLSVVQAVATAEAAGCSTAAIKGRVNTESLILRREPNTNAEKLANLKAGDQLIILAQNKSTNWLLVITSDNLTGWVGSPYVFLTKGKLADIPIVDETTVVATQAATVDANATQVATPCATAAATMAATVGAANPTTVTGKVNTDSLVVRNLPNTTAEKLKVLKAGDTVTVLGQTKNGNWLQIQTADSIVGWVGSPYVVLTSGKLSDLPITE